MTDFERFPASAARRVSLKVWQARPWDATTAGLFAQYYADGPRSACFSPCAAIQPKSCKACILAIPNYRLKVTDKTVVTFRERPAGQPEALRAWFYPGRNWGEEFVYPRAIAIELARTTNTPVLFIAAEIPVEVTEPIKTADEPVVLQLKQAPVMAIRPTGEEVEMAAVVTTPPVAELQPDTAPTEVAAMLPQTASPLPLIALFGLLALGGALGLRLVQKRIL